MVERSAASQRVARLPTTTRLALNCWSDEGQPTPLSGWGGSTSALLYELSIAQLPGRSLGEVLDRLLEHHRHDSEPGGTLGRVAQQHCVP
jgi:hypothetical protein